MSDDSGKPGLFGELKRRSVFRAAALYAVVAWVLVQIGEATFEPLGLPEGSQRLLIILLGLGFPVAVVLAWIFDLTPEGIVRTPDDPAAEVAHLRTGRRIDFAVIGALLIVVGLMLWGSERDPVQDELPAAAPRLDLAELIPPANPPLPDKPSVVVLPFDNMSGDPEQEYFADGITEDLTTDLSRHPLVFVIARNSAFTYKGKAVRVEDVGRELGVRYVVEGSVRKVADRVRITAQLIDATSGLHLWSERYDRELADIFALQDEIVAAILDSVGVEIQAEEFARARRKPTEDLGAYDAFMRGLSHKGLLTRRDNAEARRWFARAIELDPEYAQAHAHLGGTYSVESAMAWNLDPVLAGRHEKQVRRCLELDPSIPECHAGLAGLALNGGSAADAIRLAERAVELAPSSSDAHLVLGMAQLRGGHPLLATQSFQRGLRLNPSGGAIEGILAFAHYGAGREREAVAIWRRVRAANPDIVNPRIMLASYYEGAGDHSQARILVQEIRAVNPDLTVGQIARVIAMRALGPEHVSMIQANLRRAGLPDRVEAEPDATAPHSSSRPGIAVLPFCNLSNDPEQEYFSDGVTEDLTAVLSRSPDLLIISRSSSSRYECQPPDLKQVGRELGVGYVVEGSVRRAQDRVRITAQLIDATTDVHVWSESYERDLSPANIFEIQSDIAIRIANTLRVQLREWEGQRPTDDPTAWDLYMRAVYVFRHAANRESQLESHSLVERAIELDPGFAPAHAMLAGTLLAQTAHAAQVAPPGQVDTELLDRAETYARRAIALDPQHAEGHLNLSVVLLAQGKRTDAIREARRAIELNASFDVAYYTLGRIQMRLGRLAEAKRSFDSAQQLNPRFPVAFFWGERGTLHYLEQEIEHAVASWERARTMTSIVYPDRIMLTHHYESAGRHEDAQAIVQEMLSVQPEITAETSVGFLARYWNEEWIPEDLEEHLRTAGLP